jgi:hypothetical protein
MYKSKVDIWVETWKDNITHSWEREMNFYDGKRKILTLIGEGNNRTYSYGRPVGNRTEYSYITIEEILEIFKCDIDEALLNTNHKEAIRGKLYSIRLLYKDINYRGVRRLGETQVLDKLL